MGTPDKYAKCFLCPGENMGYLGRKGTDQLAAPEMWVGKLVDQ